MKNIFDSLIHKIFKSRNLIFAPFIQQKLNYNGDVSKLPSISITIPVIEKDVDLLELNVRHLRLHCQNPINVIYVVSPESEKIKALCESLKLFWINEKNIEPVSKENILKAIKDPLRVNWMYQQFLKLNLDTVLEDRYCLIIDADTILLKDQYFLSDEHVILKTSDEYHFLYGRTNKLLMPEFATNFKSFIAHHQLFDCLILKELRDKVTSIQGIPFFDAVLKYVELNGRWFSEYELYGNYLITYHSKQIKLVYWNNKNLYKEKYSNEQIVNYSKKYASISFHNYKYDTFT